MNTSRFALVAALGVAALPAAAQTRDAGVTQAPLESYQVATESARTVGHNCVYRTSVRGTMQASPREAEGAVRGADLRTRATLLCNGREAGTREDHVVLPEATVPVLNARIAKGLSLSEPGSNCTYASGLRIAPGLVEIDQPVTSCKVLPSEPPAAQRHPIPLQPLPPRGDQQPATGAQNTPPSQPSTGAQNAQPAAPRRD